MASSGKTGRRLTARLRAEGVPVRAASRSATGRERFEWGERDTWGPALEGVRAAYVVPLEAAGEAAAEAVDAFARQAVASGVERLVLLSAHGYPEATEAPERAVREAGAEWTVLRPSWFSQNFSEDFLRDPVLAGEVRLPTGEGRVPFIDAEDIAEVAAAALTGSGHHGRSYALTGPRLMTFGDAVAEIATATGRGIRYVPVSDEEYAARLRAAGLGEEAAREVLGLLAPLREDAGALPGDGVERALGRAPRDFAAYARAAAAEGVWDA